VSGAAVVLRRAATALATLVALALPALWPFAALAQPAAAAEAEERLTVADPFLELHTGAGRGYPVFFVVERGAAVVVELRRTDWFRVRTAGGQVGWVPRAQIERTLTEAGVGKSFRDILLDDFLRRRVEFGGGGGRFGGEPMLKLWLGLRLADPVGVELAGGQVQGTFSGTDFWHLSLVAEPWHEQRWSPFISVGLGTFRNIPNRSLVDATGVNAKLAHATAGLRWYISERFVARADATLYTAFVADNRSLEYRAVSLGLAFFF
jgi:hypothetical protein